MGDFCILPFHEKNQWNAIVQSFHQYDVYYLNEYVSAFRYTKDGDPFLLYYQGDEMRLCFVIQQSDIADCPNFCGALENERFYDWSTPYGYGGPLTENLNREEIREFFHLLSDFCRAKNIVSLFIRFHPLLQNQKDFEGCCELYQVKKTVYMDLSNIPMLEKNLEARCRGAIQKARRNGVVIQADNSPESQRRFMELYMETMRRRDALDYYFFSEEFFCDFFTNMNSYYDIYNAVLEGETVSSAIILRCNGNLHYHLSAARREYLCYAPNNLLLYTVALRGAEEGYKNLHLGGGTEMEDSLLLFKKSFNRHGLLDFYLGRCIFCKDAYEELLRLRCLSNPDFQPDNDRIIQYRFKE